MNYRKLTASILIAICLVGTLSACGKEEAKTDKTNEITKTESSEDITDSKDKKDEKKDKVNVTIDEIELLDFKVKEPDSIGTVYMEAKFKNNSKYTITYIDYEYKVDDEKTYLSSSDTLLPGEVSSLTETFGPKSGEIKDAQLLKTSITFLDEDKNEYYTDYDVKLDSYETFKAE